MKMFNGLGSGVCVNKPGQESLDFETTVTWAMKHLRKDDRIIWLLGIVQRATLLRLRDTPKGKRTKIRRKIEYKLKGFDEERVNADFESGFMFNWPHYASLVKVYQLGRMKDYSFHFKVGNRLVPKPAAEVLLDHEEMEEQLQKLAGGERFCSDGEPFLEHEDGWTWFEIREGWSSQEAKAMRHCGNGVGRQGDRLLSLREPVPKGDLQFWKPHLTFILNDGSLGEMKGFANEKPERRYHPYVEGLLSHPEVRQVRGGGYRPDRNFSFEDLGEESRKQTIEANPGLAFDPFGEGGEVLVEGDEARWIQMSKPDFPEKVARLPGFTGLPRASSEWIAFQTPITTSRRTAWTSQAWCLLNKGLVGPLGLAKEGSVEPLAPTAPTLLRLPHLKEFIPGHDPLAEYSNWGNALDLGGCCELMQDKPACFRYSSLSDVWSITGLSEPYLSVLNDRFGLGVRKATDGIEIQRFVSPQAFAAETRNRRYARLLRQLGPDNLREWFEFSPFDVPWLKLRPAEDQSATKSVSLILTAEGAEIFFEIMDFENLKDFQGIVPEIVYRFGLRAPPGKPLPAAA